MNQFHLMNVLNQIHRISRLLMYTQNGKKTVYIRNILFSLVSFLVQSFNKIYILWTMYEYMIQRIFWLTCEYLNTSMTTFDQQSVQGVIL